MNWKDTAFMDLAEIQRDTLRRRGQRVTFDCFHMKALRDGQTAKCCLGHTKVEDIMFILLGKQCDGCRYCRQYDSGA